VRFLLVSKEGDGLGIARRLVDEGHDVVATIKDHRVKGDYDGLINKIPKLDLSIPKETIIFFDSSGGGKTAERLRGQGYSVAFGSVFADQLELDRATALGLMEEAGIQVPPSQHFTDWPSGIQHAEAHQGRLCFKSDNNKITSYVSSGPEDMVEFLRTQEKNGKPADFELQEFVKGLEISTELWFDGYDYARPLNHTFEKKQLMNDDIGPSSGCAGNVVWACMEEQCRVCEEGIKRMVPILRHHQYVGMIDLNSIVNEEGVWGLEFTPRTGYDAFPALLDMLTDELGDLIARYARGDRSPKFPIREKGFGAGIRVTIPPYPFVDVDAPKGIAIRNLVRADRAHSYFYNVFLDDEGQLRSSGAFGAIAVFTSFGDDIFSSIAKCEEIAKRVDLKDRQYRTDLGSVFEKQYREFKDAIQIRPPQDVQPSLSLVG